MQKILLIAGCCVLAGGPAVAQQQPLTTAEFSMCVAYSDYVDRLVTLNHDHVRQLDGMTMDRSSCSSVDYYNRQVARVDATGRAAQSLQGDMDAKCNNRTIRTADYYAVCGSPQFGRSMSGVGLCARLARQTSADTGGEHSDGELSLAVIEPSDAPALLPAAYDFVETDAPAKHEQ